MSESDSTKLIPLTQGKFAIVDAEDYERLMQHKWYYSKKGYAMRGIRNMSLSKGYKNVIMHREVNNTPDGMITDHINGNKLDNRRSNLRNATEPLNRYNVLRSDNKAGYPGVSWSTAVQRWRPYITKDGKRRTLGTYVNLEDAIAARKKAEADTYPDFQYSARDLQDAA